MVSRGLRELNARRETEDAKNCGFAAIAAIAAIAALCDFVALASIPPSSNKAQRSCARFCVFRTQSTRSARGAGSLPSSVLLSPLAEPR